MIGEVLAVAWKELQVLFKDKGALAVFILLPMVLAPVMAAPNLTGQQMMEGSTEGEGGLVATAYLVNEDAGIYGAQIASALQDLPLLDITTMDSVQEADQLVAIAERPAAIVIPADFSQKIEANEPTEILVIADPTQQALTSYISGIVNQVVSEIGILGEIQFGIRAVLAETGALEGAAPELQQAVSAQILGVIWTAAQEMRQNPLIAVRSEDLEGAEAEGAWNPFGYYVPSSAVMFAFFLISYMASTLLKEKEEGSFRRLLASPMYRGSIIGGKILAYCLVVFLQVLLLFGMGIIFFNVSLGNAPFSVLLITIGLALSASSMGLLLGALSKTSKQADNLGIILGFVLAAIGGCLTPFFRDEGVIGFISRLTPHAHALKAYVDVILDEATLVQVCPTSRRCSDSPSCSLRLPPGASASTRLGNGFNELRVAPGQHAARSLTDGKKRCQRPVKGRSSAN